MKKIGLTLLALGLFALVLVGVKPAKASAAITGPYSTNLYQMTIPMYEHSTWFDRDYLMGYRDLYNDFFFNRILERNIRLSMITPDNFVPENVILLNRETSDRFVLRNAVTGPFSVNRVVLTVDDRVFREFINDVSVSQAVDIRVNTGNNTVSFNTIAGGLTTGGVDINIQ